MVAGKHKTLQWEMPSLATNTGLVTGRGFPRCSRSIKLIDNHRGNVDIRGDEFSKTFSKEISPASIQQGRKDRVNSLPDRQQHSIVLSTENERTGSSTLIRISKVNCSISMSKGITITDVNFAAHCESNKICIV